MKRFDVLRGVSLGFSAVAAGALLLVAGFLLWASLPALSHEGLGLFGTATWAYRKARFGAAAMLYGTAVVSGIALLLAAPLGIAAALFVSEVLPQRFRTAAKVVVELLAGIPSVVYGLLGVLFLRSWMQSLTERLGWETLSGDTLLTAGVLLAVMILPTIVSLAEDAFGAVPASARDAARGLGLTRAETCLTVVVPMAAPGLVGAILLALGRALGETTAVFLVVGRADNRLPEGFFSLARVTEAGQTITSKLGGSEPNLALGDPLHTGALLSLALFLLVTVVLLTGTADVLRGRLARGRA